MTQEAFTNRPFKVLSRARPRRTAFLINPEDCPRELVDTIFESNYSTWGGRYNPIIPVVSGEISDSYWALLRFVDPDIIYSYSDISGDMIRRLDHELCPLGIVRHRKLPPAEAHPSYWPSVCHEQVSSAALVPLIIQKAGQGLWKPRLLTSSVERTWPEYGLVLKNFGILDERMAIKPYPEGQEKIVVNPDWTQDRFFEEVANEVNPVVFPFQASEAYAEFPESDKDYLSDYSLVVGDQVQDWIYFWNRVFGLSAYKRSRWNALCIPADSFSRQPFLIALKKFLTKFAYRNGSSPAIIELTTSSVPPESLEEIKTILFRDLDAIPKIGRIISNETISTSLENRSYPEFYYPGAHLFEKKWTTYQQATSRKSLLATPDSPVATALGIRIMDLRIEHIPEYPFFSNEELWWQLPRQRELVDLFLPHSRSRVSVDQSISTEIGAGNVFELTIPTVNSVIRIALGASHRFLWGEDFKIERKDPFYDRLDLSDKGEYANGIINLFGGLQNAGMFFENSYWRSIAEDLSQRNPSVEKETETRIKNRLKKKADILRRFSEAPDDAIDFLSYEVLKLSRNQLQVDIDISFSELDERFQKQREAYIEKNPDYRKDSTEEAVKAKRAEATNYLSYSLQSYTDSGIFKQGVRLRCDTCGSKYWAIVDEVKQENRCPGCGGIASLPVRAHWRFRLSTLLRNAVAFHGCIPVILCLYSLRSSRAKHAFLYLPGLNMFLTSKDKRPSAEIDFACIIDGKLVIGEVKTNSKEFSSTELTKLADLVKKFEAKAIILACFKDERGQMGSKKGELEAILKDGSREVWIYVPSSHIFEPTPNS